MTSARSLGSFRHRTSLVNDASQYLTAKALWDRLAITYELRTDSSQIFDLHKKANLIWQNMDTLEECWNNSGLMDYNWSKRPESYEGSEWYHNLQYEGSRRVVILTSNHCKWQIWNCQKIPFKERALTNGGSNLCHNSKGGGSSDNFEVWPLHRTRRIIGVGSRIGGLKHIKNQMVTISWTVLASLSHAVTTSCQQRETV